MTDGPDPERLDALERRLREARAARAPKRSTQGAVSGSELGWRMVTELLAGLLIGFGMGYGLDAAFGTAPWLMLVLTMFGFAAGVRTMLRTAAEFERKNAARDAADEGAKDGD